MPNVLESAYFLIMAVLSLLKNLMVTKCVWYLIVYRPVVDNEKFDSNKFRGNQKDYGDFLL